MVPTAVLGVKVPVEPVERSGHVGCVCLLCELYIVHTKCGINNMAQAPDS